LKAPIYTGTQLLIKRIKSILSEPHIYLSIILATLVIGSVSISSSITSTVHSGLGLYVNLNLYEIDTENHRVVDITEVLERQNISMYVEVNAIAPPRFEGDVVTLHWSYSRASRKFFIPLKNWIAVARDWVSTIESRGGDVRNTYSGLILRIIIFNEASREVFFQFYDSISYIPYEIASGKSLAITIHAIRNSAKASYLETSYVQNLVRVGFHVVETNASYSPYTIIRVPVLRVTPENLTSQLPSSYFKNVNGKLYVKTPIMIVRNDLNENNTSGTIGMSINIGVGTARTGVYPTFTVGVDIFSKINNGIVPSVTLWKGSGFTWGGTSYYFGYNHIVPPNTARWIWVWARPVYTVYNTYNCGPFNCVPWYDEVEAIIADILTEGSTILGGSESGLPHQSLINMLFNGTTLKRLIIPGTHLSNGDLEPGEYVALEQIFNYYDTCDADFEVGIPVGAITALACGALGTPVAGAACSAFLSRFGVSLSMEGGSAFVTGNLVNQGDIPEIPNDHNVLELIDVAFSKFRYKVDPPWWCWWCSPCYYNVTIGIYFSCK